MVSLSLDRLYIQKFELMPPYPHLGGDPATYATADVYGESLTASETVTLANGSTEVAYTYTQ